MRFGLGRRTSFVHFTSRRHHGQSAGFSVFVGLSLGGRVDGARNDTRVPRDAVRRSSHISYARLGRSRQSAVAFPSLGRSVGGRTLEQSCVPQRHRSGQRRSISQSTIATVSTAARHSAAEAITAARAIGIESKRTTDAGRDQSTATPVVDVRRCGQCTTRVRDICASTRLAAATDELEPRHTGAAQPAQCCRFTVHHGRTRIDDPVRFGTQISVE